MRRLLFLLFGLGSWSACFFLSFDNLVFKYIYHLYVSVTCLRSRKTKPKVKKLNVKKKIISTIGKGLPTNGVQLCSIVFYQYIYKNINNSKAVK